VNYTVGIDSGSTATKGILLADGVTRRFLCPTPFRPADAIHEAWNAARWPHGDAFLTLTGYGRQLVDFADKQVTEISCHGLGARLLAPDTRTVIDIGGQDSKVIQLDAGGNLSDFLMNDKCAAGTGRFLEVISRTSAPASNNWTASPRRRAACHYQHVHGVCRIGGH
jgi:predicted CoA-substrate-specific enzyme activase